jgi:SAM-dependent methyltransferase
MNKNVYKFYSDIDKDRVRTNISWDSKTVMGQFETMPGAKFLDIGCYDGSKTIIMIASKINAEEIHGVDFLTDRMKHARKLGIHTEFADINDGIELPFPDNYFDAIFVGDVIEHVYSPDFLLQEIKRLLCLGGYTIITTPNLASWRNRIVLALGWQPFSTEVSLHHRVGNPRNPKGGPSGHIRVFTPRALKELIPLYDMKVEFLGGLVNQTPRSGITIVTGLIDDLFSHFIPTMCDEIIVKARKPQK